MQYYFDLKMEKVLVTFSRYVYHCSEIKKSQKSFLPSSFRTSIDFVVSILSQENYITQLNNNKRQSLSGQVPSGSHTQHNIF